MILADTSVWIAHFRSADPELLRLTEAQEIVCHNSVIGELACGNLPARRNLLNRMWDLSPVLHASDQQVLELIEAHQLYGRGLGWIDLHLLTSALLSHAQLWTLDTRLAKTAAQFQIAYP